MNHLIIFKEKNLQSTWLGKKSLKDTYYGVSENSWMTTSIFHDWFQTFVCKVEVRPILLLFDGHLTHLSAATVEFCSCRKYISDSIASSLQRCFTTISCVVLHRVQISCSQFAVCKAFWWSANEFLHFF